MPKQNGPSKPAHRPARKAKPKFDVPAGVGEPTDAGWVYRDEPPEMVVETPAATAASLVAEAIAAPIAGAIGATAAVEPQPARRPPSAPIQTNAEPIHEAPRDDSSDSLRSTAIGIFGLGLGLMQIAASTVVTLVTAPLVIARRIVRG